MSSSASASPGPRAHETLLIAASHGFPRSHARLARVQEVAAALSRRGITVDTVLLSEKAFQPGERPAVASLRGSCRHMEVVPHPANGSLLVRWLYFCRQALLRQERIGEVYGCPPRNLRRLLRSRYVPRGYGSVFVFGLHLARSLQLFRNETLKVLDVPRIRSVDYRSHAAQGRADACVLFADPSVERELMDTADIVAVPSRSDEPKLRELGFRGRVCRLPFAAAEAALAQDSSDYLARPPHILCVGSDTTANLDGWRWFRRQVFPAVMRSVPSCRLRLVGEAARHIEPGPGIDRLGWVDSLDLEYRRAWLVAIPLRVGTGLRRRVVEAMSWGKAIATTSVGGWGVGLLPLEEAIVQDDPGALGRDIVRVLTSDMLRDELGNRVRKRARQLFHPADVCADLPAPLGGFERESVRVTEEQCEPA